MDLGVVTRGTRLGKFREKEDRLVVLSIGPDNDKKCRANRNPLELHYSLSNAAIPRLKPRVDTVRSA
jgi:hypothetical protein